MKIYMQREHLHSLSTNRRTLKNEHVLSHRKLEMQLNRQCGHHRRGSLIKYFLFIVQIYIARNRVSTSKQPSTLAPSFHIKSVYTIIFTRLNSLFSNIRTVNHLPNVFASRTTLGRDSNHGNYASNRLKCKQEILACK